METNVRVELDAQLCIRCASCVTLAPGVFEIDSSVAIIVRQPATERELRECEAAALNCPVGAVILHAQNGVSQ